MTEITNVCFAVQDFPNKRASNYISQPSIHQKKKSEQLVVRRHGLSWMFKCTLCAYSVIKKKQRLYEHMRAIHPLNIPKFFKDKLSQMFGPGFKVRRVQKKEFCKAIQYDQTFDLGTL